MVHPQDESLPPLRIERVPQRQQLVQEATKRPDIRLVIVGIILEDLGRHIVGSTDAGSGKIPGASEDLEQQIE